MVTLYKKAGCWYHLIQRWITIVLMMRSLILAIDIDREHSFVVLWAEKYLLNQLPCTLSPLYLLNHPIFDFDICSATLLSISFLCSPIKIISYLFLVWDWLDGFGPHCLAARMKESVDSFFWLTSDLNSQLRMIYQ